MPRAASERTEHDLTLRTSLPRTSLLRAAVMALPARTHDLHSPWSGGPTTEYLASAGTEMSALERLGRKA